MPEPDATLSQRDLRLLALDQAAAILPFISAPTVDDAMTLVERVLTFITTQEEAP